MQNCLSVAVSSSDTTTMFMEIIWCAILAFLLYALFTCRKPHGYPPGPTYLPFIGNIPKLKELSKSLGGQHLAFMNLAKTYGDVVGLKMGGDRLVVVHSYEKIKDVLLREEFDSRPDSFFIRLRSLGTKKGITCTDGEFWTIQRRFLVRHLRDLGFGKARMDVMIVDELKEMLDVIDKKARDGLQLGPMLSRAVVNILWALVAGSRIVHAPRLEKLIGLLAVRAKAFDMSGGLLNQLPWLRFVVPETIGYSMVVRLNEKLKEFLMETINEHQATWREGREDDFIYTFITEMKRGEDSTFTIDQLLMVCLDIVIAGAHTTSNTIDFAILMMVLHPEIQTKVQEELDAATKNGTTTIEYKDRNLVPYMEAVLTESLRFRSVTPVTGPRRALKDTQIDGHKIAKDTVILINNYSINTDPEIWGDPEVFRPERFLGEKGQMMANKYVMPFNKGRRRCLGDVLARASVFTFFAGIMKNYRVGVQEGTPKPTGLPIPGLILSPEKWIGSFTKRN